MCFGPRLFGLSGALFVLLDPFLNLGFWNREDFLHRVLEPRALRLLVQRIKQCLNLIVDPIVDITLAARGVSRIRNM